MWNCIECGCKAIAASLLRCPVCGKERDMAKTTIAGPSGDDASLARAAALLDVPGVIEALDAPYEPPADPPEPEPPAGPPAAVPEPAEALSEPPQVVKGSGGVTLPKFGVSNG